MTFALSRAIWTIGAACAIQIGRASASDQRHFFDASRRGEWQGGHLMVSRASVLVVDCTDAVALAAFWAEVFDWDALPPDERGWVVVAPSASKAPIILLFVPVIEHAKQKNRLHIDVNPVAVDHESEVRRLVELGATRTTHAASEDPWTTMQDPEGNYFCVMHRTVT